MRKFKVGDTVKIRKKYRKSNDGWCSDTHAVFVVTDVDSGGCIILSIGGGEKIWAYNNELKESQ